MKSSKQFLSLLLLSLIFICKISFALPFSITPISLPTTVATGSEAFAYYTVTNITSEYSPNSFVKFLPPTVKQAINTFNPSLCGPLFNLPSGGSCTLKLVVAGAVDVNDPNPQHHLFVCRQNGKTCAGPTTQLNVSTISLVSITVLPPDSSIPNGTHQKFTAVGTYSDGSTKNLPLASWSSSNSTIASITPFGGVATANSVGGPITITAISGTVSGSTSLTVDNATLSSIAVTPATASIAAGNTQQFTATGTYSDHTTADITQSVNWTSSNQTIATISNSSGSNGEATGIAAGGVTITASLSGHTGTAALTVTNATLTSIAVRPTTATISVNTQQQYVAEGFYSDSSIQDVTDMVTWSSSNPAVAIISSFVSAGLATALEVGTTTILATSGAIVSAPVTLTVVPRATPHLFAGTTAPNPNVCVSSDRGVTWPTGSCISFATTVNGLATASGLAFAGFQSGDVCRSTNNGGSWSCPATLAAPVISIAAGPTFLTNVYAGMNNGDVSVSTNNGLTFGAGVATGAASSILSLAVDQSNVYAGRANGQVCVSTDQGTSWGSCVAVTGSTRITSLAVTTGYVYAGTFTGNVCASTDDGATWPSANCIPLGFGAVLSLAVDSTNGYLYAGTTDGHVCVSYDNGSSFPTCVSVASSPVLALAVDDVDFVYAGLGNGNVCVSTSNGNAWPSNLCAAVTSSGTPVSSLAAGMQ